MKPLTAEVKLSSYIMTAPGCWCRPMHYTTNMFIFILKGCWFYVVWYKPVNFILHYCPAALTVWVVAHTVNCRERKNTNKQPNIHLWNMFFFKIGRILTVSYLLLDQWVPVSGRGHRKLGSLWSAGVHSEVEAQATVPERSQNSLLHTEKNALSLMYNLGSLFLSYGFFSSNMIISVIFLTSTLLRPLKAQLGVFVQAHAPQFGHIFCWGGDECEAITTSSRRDLQQKKTKKSLAVETVVFSLG